MELEHKAFAGGVEVKDASKGIVEAVVARVNVPDHDGDVFLPGAFGEQRVKVSAYNHTSWPHRGGKMPVGKGALRERGNDVVATLQFFMGTQDGREHFEHVKEMGDLQEWSYGWPPGHEERAELTDEQEAQGIRRAIRKVPVVEVSPVMMAASIGTRTVAVKAMEKAAEEVLERFANALVGKVAEGIKALDVGAASTKESSEPSAESEAKGVEGTAPEEPDERETIAREVARFEAIKARAENGR